MRTWTTAAIVLTTALSFAGAAQAESVRPPDLRIGLSTMLRDVVTPPEWGGIWEIDDHTYDCETEELLGSEAYTDTICAGSSIDFENPGFELTCNGTADASTVSVTCTGSFEIIPDCVMEFSSVFTATRDGDTFTSVHTVSTSYVGEGCLFLPNDCTRTESTATRIAPEPNPCEQTPVATVDWGTVKALYR